MKPGTSNDSRPASERSTTCVPRRYDPLAELLPLPELQKRLADLKASIAGTAAAMPGHESYIALNCKGS